MTKAAEEAEAVRFLVQRFTSTTIKTHMYEVLLLVLYRELARRQALIMTEYDEHCRLHHGLDDFDMVRYIVVQESFRAEWRDRFGFLATEHAPDSFESIDEVACLFTRFGAEPRR